MKLVLTLFVAALLPLFAQAAEMPPGPVLAAESYVLYDLTSNQILVNSGGNTHIAPASLTKLMTAYLTFSAIEQQKFAVNLPVYPSLDAVRPQDDESRMFLDHNKAATVEELLHGLIIQSASDAARALAELIAGNEANFAELMNQQAQRLGMKDTHFTNATGRDDPAQYTSAYDMMLLVTAIMHDFPDYYPIFGVREYQYNKISQFNRNRLLWNDPFVDGMKTGFSIRAGFSLIASAKRYNRRLISVILGANSDNARITESQKLLNFGFQRFEAVQFYQKNQVIASPRVWKGTASHVNIGFPQGLSVTIPKGALPQFKAIMETRQPIVAPIKKGQQVGTLRLSLDGKPYAEYPLLALADVPLANIFARGLDALRLMFQ